MINNQWRELSTQPAPDNFVLKVTPQGIVERKPAFKERLHQFGIDLQRIRFIVGSEARTRIFDKALGQAWLLLEPIVMALLYFFITTVIFTYSGEQRQFLFILTSVVFWRWFSRTIDGAPLSIIGYGAVLKQTRFPVIMVVLGFMATETFFFLMSFIVLAAFLGWHGAFPTTAYVYLPLVVAAQFSLMLFLTVVFAVIGTFIKDLSGVLYAVTGIWWYLSPGIYPVSKIPEQYLWIYMLNPFAHILPAYRDILIDGVAPATGPLWLIVGVSSVLCVLAIRVFNWARYYFFAFL